MNLGSPVVSLGGITIGTIILTLVLQRWWKKGSSKGKKGDDGSGGGRDVKALLPFVLALAYGMLAVLAASSASALGLLTRLGLWGGDGLGTLYLIYGVGGTSPTLTRAAPVVLTAGGYAVYAIWTALVIGHHLWSKKLPRLHSLAGVLAGILLGLSRGIAGVSAVPLASLVNLAGGWYSGAVS